MFGITKIYLFFLFIFLSGCSHKKIIISDSNFSSPQDELYSLKGDLNSTDVPPFQSIISIKGLKNLVDKALQNNPQWQAQLVKLNVVRTKQGLVVSPSKPSLKGSIGWREGKEKTRESGFKEQPMPSWYGGALFNWEVDLWGKWKTVKKSALIHVQEAEYLKQSSKIVFVHEIANTWISLAAQKEQLSILNRSIISQQQSKRFYEKRVEVGKESNVTLARQNVIYDQLQLEYANMNRMFEITKLRMQNLIGDQLNSLDVDIPNISEIQLPELPKVFPTVALKKRPDLMSKESKIKESIYLQRSMEYDLYPSLSFQTSGLFFGSSLSEPFEQWKASMGPVLKLPVWSPRKKVKVIVSKEETKLYKEEWKALINLAIEEIESSTRSFVMSLSELSLAEKTSKETKKILSITKSKLEAGIVSQLELIEDERQFLETNRKAVVSRLQVFQFALDLTKALGLQWEE